MNAKASLQSISPEEFQPILNSAYQHILSISEEHQDFNSSIQVLQCALALSYLAYSKNDDDLLNDMIKATPLNIEAMAQTISQTIKHSLIIQSIT